MLKEKKLEKAKIHVSKYHAPENRTLVIEGDEHSIWAYVLDASKQIEFDGFICSRGTILESLEEIERFIKNDIQPPLVKRFANKNAVQEGIKNNSLKVEWENKLIRIFLNEMEFLKMDTKNKKSYSRSIAQKGPYGIPLDEY